MQKFITSDKIMYYPHYLSQWELGHWETIPPITIELHPSNVCNHKCYYCFAEKQKDGRLMTTEDAFKIINRLVALETKGLILSGGGEPTLHPDIDKIILYAKKKGLEIGLITNGSALSKKLQEVILDCCTWVRFSFDSANPATYKKIRGVDMAEKTYKNIHNLVMTRHDRKSKCTIGAQAVVTEHNVQDLHLTAIALMQTGVDYFQMRPLENETYSKEFYDEAIKGMEAAQAAAPDLHCIVSGKWKIVNPHTDLKDRGYKACWCYPFIGAITVDGNIYICCHFVGIKQFCYGNMITDRTEDILQNRDIAGANIKLANCPLACRGNQINIRLEGLKRGCEHQAFL